MEIFNLKDSPFETQGVKDIQAANTLSNAFWCVGTGEYPLSLWRIDNDITKCVDAISSQLFDGKVEKMAIASSGPFLVTMTNTGQLSLWDANT